MAEGKKSFVVYTSWRLFLDDLTNEQLGAWFKWVMDYCNDIEPDYPQDQATRLACKMTQDVLKRDLKKYEAKVESIKTARENRKINNKNNTENNVEINNEIKDEIKTDSSSVNVNVNDNVNVNVNDISNDIDNKKKVKEKTSAEVAHSYGEYKRIKLKDSQYKKLCTDFGKGTTDVAITKLDEYVQSNNNKNGYKDFYLVLRKVIQNDWFGISKDLTPIDNGKIEELLKLARAYPREERHDILIWQCDEATTQRVMQILDNENARETF